MRNARGAMAAARRPPPLLLVLLAALLAPPCAPMQPASRQVVHPGYPQGYSALCVVARDENIYVKEFVQYHRCLGGCVRSRGA
jgi:hypothetical protein